MNSNNDFENRPSPNGGETEKNGKSMNTSLSSVAVSTGGLSETVSDADNLALRQWKSGNQRGYNELIRRYERPLFHFIFRMIRDADEAKDLLQETFVRFFRSKESLREDKNLKAWLYQTANHLCIDHLRKHKPGRFLTVDHQDEAFVSSVDSMDLDRRPQPDEEVMDRETQDQIVSAIQSLPKHQRMIMSLRCGQEKSLQEIAEVMGCSAKTVGTTLFAARKKLMKKLRPIFDEFYGRSSLQSVEKGVGL